MQQMPPNNQPNERENAFMNQTAANQPFSKEERQLFEVRKILS
jgi:hypothetical protein